jgi:hypothetical protein
MGILCHPQDDTKVRKYQALPWRKNFERMVKCDADEEGYETNVPRPFEPEEGS